LGGGRCCLDGACCGARDDKRSSGELRCAGALGPVPAGRLSCAGRRGVRRGTRRSCRGPGCPRRRRTPRRSLLPWCCSPRTAPRPAQCRRSAARCAPLGIGAHFATARRGGSSRGRRSGEHAPARAVPMRLDRGIVERRRALSPERCRQRRHQWSTRGPMAVPASAVASTLVANHGGGHVGNGRGTRAQRLRRRDQR